MLEIVIFNLKDLMVHAWLRNLLTSNQLNSLSSTPCYQSPMYCQWISEDPPALSRTTLSPSVQFWHDLKASAVRSEPHSPPAGKSCLLMILNQHSSAKKSIYYWFTNSSLQSTKLHATKFTIQHKKGNFHTASNTNSPLYSCLLSGSFHILSIKKPSYIK